MSAISDFVGPSSRTKEFLDRCKIKKSAIDDGVDILPCPAGSWQGEKSVEVEHRPDYFPLDDELQHLGEAYRIAHPAKIDRDKLCVRNLGPGVLDDGPLKLGTVLTKYSTVLAFHEALLANDDRALRFRRKYERQSLDPDDALSPHIAVVHATATTTDNMLVLGLRSKKLDYYPSTWSCSFEEQLWIEDLSAGNQLLFRATARGANEEYFGKNSQIVNESNVRVLGVFLQYDILNLTFCAHVDLPVSSEELYHRWRESDPDPEFTDLQAVSLDLDMLARILRSDRFPFGLSGPGGGSWHPTSRYRLARLMRLKWGYNELTAALETARLDTPRAPAGLMSVDLGIDPATGKEVQWNLEGRHNNHLLVIGASGTGKSTVLKKAIKGCFRDDSLRLVVDPKHEFSVGTFPLDSNLPQVLPVSSSLPFNPFELPALRLWGPTSCAAELARVFADSYALDRKHQDMLTDQIVKAYELAGIYQNEQASWVKPAPEWRNLQILIRNKDDPTAKELSTSLGGCLSGPGVGRHLSDLVRSSLILDISKSDASLSALCTGLLLLASYRHAIYERKSPGYLLIVIDEARRFEQLGILEQIAREGRDFDVVLVLSTQGVDDVPHPIRDNMSKTLKCLEWGKVALLS